MSSADWLNISNPINILNPLSHNYIFRDDRIHDCRVGLGFGEIDSLPHSMPEDDMTIPKPIPTTAPSSLETKSTTAKPAVKTETYASKKPLATPRRDTYEIQTRKPLIHRRRLGAMLLACGLAYTCTSSDLTLTRGEQFSLSVMALPTPSLIILGLFASTAISRSIRLYLGRQEVDLPRIQSQRLQDKEQAWTRCQANRRIERLTQKQTIPSASRWR